MCINKEKIIRFKDANIFLIVSFLLLGYGIIELYFLTKLTSIEMINITVTVILTSFSLSIALLSIYLTLKLKIISEIKQEISDISNLITSLKLVARENKYNIELIKELIERKENFVPPDILEKQLKRKGLNKYIPTDQENIIIAKGGLWIPKDNFSYENAFQLFGFSNMLGKKFRNQIAEYIDKGKRLNSTKDLCQQWRISRGSYNQDETKDYYNALDNAKSSSIEFRKSLRSYYKHFISKLEKLKKLI